MVVQAGTWVEVRSREEILRTLDASGRLDGLPFMPQMLDYCGLRFRVYKSAHKTCDTVNRTGGRNLPDGVHLENLRCDGNAYGGCQAACLLFWKTAWLTPVEGPLPGEQRTERTRREPQHGLDASDPATKVIWDGRLAAEQPTVGGPVYACQATELPQFTSLLKWWDARQYVEDYRSGNVSLPELLRGSIYAVVAHHIRPSYGRLERFRAMARALYDRIAPLVGAVPFPRRRGALPAGERAPVVNLNLLPGEWVRVKSFEEIRRSIDTNCMSNGLFFDAEMVPYCGKVFRVKSRVSKFVNEENGRLVSLKTPAVILEGVWCGSRYSEKRMFCPRAIYSWWREAWLERVDDMALLPDAVDARPERVEIPSVCPSVTQDN